MAESSTVSTSGATQARAVSFVATSLIAAIMVTGCTDRENAPAAVRSTAATMTSSEANSPGSAAEQARATQAVVDFWMELDRLALDPERPMAELSTVASGQALAKWRELTTNMRRSGDQQVGTVSVREPSAHYDAKTDAYTVEACLDVSPVDVMDKNGASIVPSDRAFRRGSPMSSPRWARPLW